MTPKEQQAARNLLAAIHRDGGHYTQAVGFVQACRDATNRFYELSRQRDRLYEMVRADNPQLVGPLVGSDADRLSRCREIAAEALASFKHGRLDVELREILFRFIIALEDREEKTRG